MSKSKEIALEVSEPQEPLIIPHSPREQLEYNLINRNITMSYSKLKNLTSPVNFMKALLEPKIKTEAMLKGSLIDTLLFEDYKFDDLYTIVNDVPTTDNQIKYAKSVVEYLKENEFQTAKEKAFKDNYKSGSLSSLDKLDAYILSNSSNKECVSQELYNHALSIADNLKSIPEIQDELAQTISFQKKEYFEFEGWKCTMIMDMFTEYGFADGKKTQKCSTDDFSKELFNMSYDVQLGLYSIGLQILGINSNPKAKYLLYDDNFNYNIATVGEDLMSYSIRKVEFLFKLLNKMVDERAFNASYGYMKSQNVLHKPRYIQGNDYGIFNQ